MTFQGDWGALIRQMGALRMALEKETVPESLVRLRQEIKVLKRQEIALRRSRESGLPGTIRVQRFAKARQEQIEARFAAWVETELERALTDRELMTQMFDEVALEEQGVGEGANSGETSR